MHSVPGQFKPLRKSNVSRASSWMSLAATTVGLDDFGRVTVGVTAQVESREALRLVVQVYHKDAHFIGGLPMPGERPLAAAQRAVSGEELQAGLAVRVAIPSPRQAFYGGVRVVAWLEPGAPDLEYDGLRARPAGAVYVGCCGVRSDRADVVLTRPAA